ncbi:MAG: LPS export ABC transporter permease LptG [Pseudomonadota bacterium]
MKTINRYIIREILKTFCLVLGMVIGLYLAIDFLEKVDNFMEAALPISRLIQFLMYEIPFVVVQVLPVAQLLAVLITVGIMNRQNEIIALKSSGVSVYRLMVPVAALGVVFSGILFAMAEFAVPLTIGHANHIWNQEVRKSSAVSSREKNIWIRGDGTIIHIRYYHPADQTIYGVTVNYFDDRFGFKGRLDAEKGTFDGGMWLLETVMAQRFPSGRGLPTVDFEAARSVDLGIVPDDLYRVAKKSEEMGIVELGSYIRKIQSEGYEATAYRVDWMNKLAFPLVCIIMSITGVGIAVRRSLREGMAMSVVYGVAVAFLYWVFHSFCLSLGYGEMLPAWGAAWVANLVFICLSSFLMMTAE